MCHSIASFVVLWWTASAISANTVPSIKPKHTIQQLQLVVLPPDAQQPQQGQPPSPAPPGFVWVQFPASYFTTQTPAITQPPSPPIAPAATTSAPAPVVTPTPPATTLLLKCLRPRGQFPSDFCNKYVNCWDGNAVEQFCPDGLLFSPKGYCDYPANVNCAGRPVQENEAPPPSQENGNGAGQETSSQAPTTASPPTIIVTLPTVDPSLRKRCLKPRGQFRSTACNKYVNCWDDIVVEQECPEGLLFSNKGYCDYDFNVNCTDSSVPSRSAPSECPLDFGTFREAKNCSNYYTCIGSKIVAKYTCPEGYRFHDTIGVCDFAERVDCSKEPLVFNPRANFLANLPKDFMQQIDGCKAGSVIALNPQCTAACLCHENVSEVVQCPSGLAYDTQSNKCLLPHLAKC